MNIKDKRDIYGVDFSPQKNSTSIPSSHSYTFKKRVRRTLGSEDDLDDKITLTNIQTNKISPFYSPPKYKNQIPDLKSVMEQNEKLRHQIKTLKQILLESSQLSRKNQLSESIRLKKDQKAEQIQKLKKIIERSYYSIKQMEQQIIKINEKLLVVSRNCLMLQKKNKNLQSQKEEFQRKIVNITAVHKQQIDTCYQRMHKLQLWIQMLNKMVQQDRKNWNSQTYQLNNLKKFYLERRASG